MSNSKTWLRILAYTAASTKTVNLEELQDKVVLSFQEQQTGEVNIWETSRSRLVSDVCYVDSSRAVSLIMI